MKLLLFGFFFSPLFTVALIVWVSSKGQVKLESLAQPLLFTLCLFWVWQSASQKIIEPVNTPSIGSENPVVTLDKNDLPIVAFAEFDDVTKSQNLQVKRLNQPVVTTRTIQ
jgi:hypothetical protein